MCRLTKGAGDRPFLDFTTAANQCVGLHSQDSLLPATRHCREASVLLAQNLELHVTAPAPTSITFMAHNYTCHNSFMCKYKISNYLLDSDFKRFHSTLIFYAIFK
ncbi:hypothetical protein B5X24_HaOG203638 [Helicoverpa armigera]|uniref:Uncharacterized protein n=1 Tax=Helicoverpa armigera TaxID=29058 RepID=A0A2W1BSC3_HELAM|nr:hypothetical protein B5X24_HaOG203638 [Helicoverpa armigera]